MAEDLWNQNHDETYDTYAAEPARRSGMMADSTPIWRPSR